MTMFGLIVGVLAAVGFVVWERRQEHPLLDVRVFRNRMLGSGSTILLVVFAIMMGLFLVVVQYLMVVLGFSAIKASAGLIPLAALMMPLSAAAPLIVCGAGCLARRALRRLL